MARDNENEKELPIEVDEQSLPSGSLMPDDEMAPRDEGDIHAAGTPGGGSEVGGLAGTNIGDGAPGNAVLEDPMGYNESRDEAEDGPYAGPSGGAVGGTPAGGRARGGTINHGISPGEGSQRGDSTIGSRTSDTGK